MLDTGMFSWEAKTLTMVAFSLSQIYAITFWDRSERKTAGASVGLCG